MWPYGAEMGENLKRQLWSILYNCPLSLKELLAEQKTSNEEKDPPLHAERRGLLDLPIQRASWGLK